MTDQYRLCCTCFRDWVPVPGALKCPACDPGRTVPNNTVTKRPRPKLPDLSQSLAGYELSDFTDPTTP